MIGLRLPADHEEIGADILEHGINNIFGGMAIAKKEGKDAINNMLETNEANKEFGQRFLQFFNDMATVSEK